MNPTTVEKRIKVTTLLGPHKVIVFALLNDDTGEIIHPTTCRLNESHGIVTCHLTFAAELSDLSRLVYSYNDDWEPAEKLIVAAESMNLM